jgi:hypothetical protein
MFQTGILKAQEEVFGNNVSVTGEVCQHEQVIPELANLVIALPKVKAFPELSFTEKM